jgi:hypothetical protein
MNITTTSEKLPNNLSDKLVVIDRKELTVKVPDEKTLIRLVVNLEAQEREYFIIER